jgi:hypothetical protein
MLFWKQRYGRHSRQNREQRDPEKTWLWVKEQVNGGYMHHLASFMRIVSDTEALQLAGFAVTDAQCDAVMEDLVAEDAFADFLGQSVVGITTYRTRRNIALVLGWPKRFSKLHSLEEGVPEATVKEFRIDRDDVVFIGARCHSCLQARLGTVTLPQRIG